MTIKRTLRRPDKKVPKSQPGLTASDARKISQISRVSQKDGSIEAVVLIPNVEIGLDNPQFASSLTLPRGNIKLDAGSIQFSDGTILSSATSVSGAPSDAQYLVLSSNSTLTAERIFTAGSGISTSDSGIGQAYTVSFNANGLTALGSTVATSDYVVIYDSDASVSKKALVSNLPFTNNSGDITSVVAGDGVSGGGTSGAVTVTVAAADSTISVAAGGISVVESNLSSIPNGALSNSTISGVSLGSNLNNLTIGNGIQLNSGTTYNGSSAVSLSIQATDSTISVASGGISVSEANLSSIPNGALSNSSLTVTAGTGMSGGGAASLGGSVTVTNAGVTSAVAGTGVSISSGTGDVTFTNTGVTSIVAGTGISISGGTGAVTVNSSAASYSPVSQIVTGLNMLLGNVSSAIVLFDASTSTDSNVVSSITNGVFAIASTGTYKASGFLVVESDSQDRADVKIRFKFTDGGNVNTSYESFTIGTLSGTSIKLQIITAYFTFADANTRTIQMDILATAAVGNITAANDKGYPYGAIEITKLS
jgi:hypothetical protein